MPRGSRLEELSRPRAPLGCRATMIPRTRTSAFSLGFLRLKWLKSEHPCHKTSCW